MYRQMLKEGLTLLGPAPSLFRKNPPILMMSSIEAFPSFSGHELRSSIMWNDDARLLPPCGMNEANKMHSIICSKPFLQVFTVRNKLSCTLCIGSTSSCHGPQLVFVMAYKFASEQPAGLKNYIGKVAIVGVSYGIIF